MNEQKTLDYARIAQAIGYIRENFKRQPGLDEIAGEVALSTAHFQRMFTEWAGISPKKFLQYTSIEYAKRILNETHASLFDAAQETGLSGTGRLYDLFVNIEGMTPGEYKNGGESLSINYSFAKSPFGEIFIASTDKGICCMEFADEHDAAFNSLRKKFPNAKFTSREMMVALMTATTASLATCLKVSLASSELLARPCTMMADDWVPTFPPVPPINGI